MLERPLRRFGAKIMVVVVHHRYYPKKKAEVQQRRMVVMEDNIKWDKFPAWVQSVAVPSTKLGGLTFSYTSHSGTQQPINSKSSFRSS